MTCRIAILLSIGFGEQDTTASGRYCTGGRIQFNLRVAVGPMNNAIERHKFVKNIQLSLIEHFSQ